MWYQFLNIFFFVFHTTFTLFNMVGWIFRSTRKWHLVTLSLTAFSWFVLGIWYGWGYCFCTQWHWEVRQKLGYADHTNSYIQFLVLKLTGINFPIQLVDDVTLIVFITCFALSIWLNIKIEYMVKHKRFSCKKEKVMEVYLLAGATVLVLALNKFAHRKAVCLF